MNGIFANVISPREEMIAYEALHAQSTSFRKVTEELSNLGGRLSTAAAMLPPALVQKARDWLDQKTNFGICVAQDFHFPQRLQDDALPSSLLYYRGDIGLLESRLISIVGSRSAGKEGLLRASKLAKELSEAGFTIVSGLAKGIDTAALSRAMAIGGKVVGVIGTPINQAYPKENAKLQEDIASNHLLISEVPFIRHSEEHFKLHGQYFVLRNRIMSAISEATVIVEAGETSGTLTQARAAIQQGRKLFILNSCFENKSITWPATYEKKGAIRVGTTQDILAALPSA